MTKKEKLTVIEVYHSVMAKARKYRKEAEKNARADDHKNYTFWSSLADECYQIAIDLENTEEVNPSK